MGDYLRPDGQTHRLYVPPTTQTLVIDEESGKMLADIPGQKTHGVALARSRSCTSRMQVVKATLRPRRINS